MLYQTQHPHFFQFHAFPSTPSSASAASANSLFFSSSSSSTTTIRAQEMEGALRPSLMEEMDMKSSPQASTDDLGAVNGAPCEDDFVNDFFDFSNDDGLDEPQVEEEEKERNHTPPVPLKPKEEHDLDQNINFDDFGPIPTGEIAVPADDVENLEWLSHFVEDSFSEYSSPFPAGNLAVKRKENVSGQPEVAPILGSPCFNTPVPAKARTKRARTSGRVWSLDSPSLSDSSTSSSSSNYSSSSSPLVVYCTPDSISILEQMERGRKQKKKSVTEMVSLAAGTGVGLVTRRCSHCGVMKTPQWRTGPLGAKTLCNACGVRFKSGRLLPEYRPACSPTFSSELHSNHHRKVLEMRRKKELLGRAEPGLAPPVVRSF